MIIKCEYIKFYIKKFILHFLFFLFYINRFYFFIWQINKILHKIKDIQL